MEASRFETVTMASIKIGITDRATTDHTLNSSILNEA